MTILYTTSIWVYTIVYYILHIIFPLFHQVRKKERKTSAAIRHTASWLLEANQSKLLPTDPFTIFEPQAQEIGEYYVVQKRRTTDFDAP